jgi:MoxR-like ATPase
MSNWIQSVTFMNWPVVKSKNVWGVNNTKFSDKTKKGDKIIFYVNQTNNFCGAYEVVSEWHEPRVTWLDATRPQEGGIEIDLKPIQLGYADFFDNLSSKLDFAKGKKGNALSFVLQNHQSGYANNGKSISDKDYEIIVNELKNNQVAPERYIKLEQQQIRKTETEEKKEKKSDVEFWKVSAGEEEVREKIWNEFRTTNSVGIFWNETGDVTTLNRKELTSIFKKLKYPEGPSSLLSFKQIKKNDIIFVNKGKRGIYAIGRATDDYKFYKTHSYHHMVPVEWIRTDYIEDRVPGNANMACSRIEDKSWVKKYVTGMSQDGFKKNPIIENLELNKQIVLYGPPGTSKTFNAKKVAVEMLLGKNIAKEDVDGKFEDLQNQNKVDLVQFHPSYSYEDFVQGIKPVTNKDGTISYDVRDGIFKKICDFEPDDDDIPDYSAKVKVSEKLTKPLLSKTIDVRFFGPGINKVKKEKFQELVQLFKEQGQSLSFFDNLDDFEEFYFLITKKSLEYRDIPGESYGFSEKTPGRKSLKPALESGKVACFFYQSKKGGFYEAAILDELVTNDVDHSKDFKILIIDEINRGNLSKIFGELIYALEYRGQQIRLQYSDFDDDETNDFLTVPENLYLIGTMNTADRSVSLFDTAMRRRFAFVPMMVDYDLIADELGIKVKEFSKSEFERIQKESKNEHEKNSILSLFAVYKLNQRISKDLRMGREKQVGHTYLLKIIKEEKQFLNVWKYQIIPLLEEFYSAKMNDLEELLDKSIFDEEKGLLDFDKTVLITFLNQIISK